MDDWRKQKPIRSDTAVERAEYRAWLRRHWPDPARDRRLDRQAKAESNLPVRPTAAELANARAAWEAVDIIQAEMVAAGVREDRQREQRRRELRPRPDDSGPQWPTIPFLGVERELKRSRRILYDLSRDHKACHSKAAQLATEIAIEAELANYVGWSSRDR